MRRLFYLVILTISLCNAPNVFAQVNADLIIINAQIFEHKNADILVIANKKIIAIDSTVNLHKYNVADAQIIDIDGAFILPGFIDNHNHVFEAMSEVGGTCSLPAEVALNQIIIALKKCRDNSAQTGWIMGHGFALENLIELPALQASQIINDIFPTQPVVFMEQTSHSAWANDAALKLANIEAQYYNQDAVSYMQLDPETAEPTGILFDKAADTLMGYAWNQAKDKQELSYYGLLDGLAEAAENGITTIGDGRMYWQRDWWEIWQKVAAENELTSRVSVRPWVYPDVKMSEQLSYFKSIFSSDLNNLLIVNQAKFYADGIVINGTAKTLKPYKDTYIPDYPYGLDFIEPAKLKQWLFELSKIGYGAHIHAIGDGGVNNALNAIAAQTPKNNINYTITHVELVDDADVNRFKKHNITADFQIGHADIANNNHNWAEPFLGAKRAHSMLNIAAIYNTGANITLSSDWDVYPLNPLIGIQNSLKMGSARGLPNIQQAIYAYTINAAKSLGLDGITGSIDIGKSADFVVLDQNITQLDIDEITSAIVLMSILEGKVVFEIE